MPGAIAASRRPPRRLALRWLAAAAVVVVALAIAAAPASAQPAGGLVGDWTFDAGTGTTAVDAVTPGHPLTLRNGAGWRTGVVGPSALSLSGRGQYAAATGPVLDTTQSYTVTAWVDPSQTNGYQTFVSQDGTQVSGFYLQLRDGQFSFAVPSADSTGASVAVAAATGIIPQPHEWYLLAGVLNTATDSIALYVNGTLAATATAPAPAAWSAAGRFAVGRAQYGAANCDFVHGEIDDVHAYQIALPASQIAAVAGTGSLRVDADVLGARTRPTQLGEFLEEISHSVDGGLYAELIRNRDLRESPRSPVAYSLVGDPAATLALTRVDPLTRAVPTSLHLSIPADPSQATVGIANGGWWGIAVQPSTTYRVSFFARATGAARNAPLTVALESDSGTVWASTSVAAPSAGWRRYMATLTTPAGLTPSLTNQFVITLPAGRAAGGSDWFTLVSVFPPTYDGLSNGFRIDLMQRLAALHPGYLRIPGGNYLEGRTVATRFNWLTTIGPITQRPGHLNTAWHYWSQDGMGLLEYLELSQELDAVPILDVWAGYTLGGTPLTRAALRPYVTQAVNELQYATGSTRTYWGHQRALDGHPAPFPVHMVEIGNEDFFDTTGSYGSYRYPMFYDAIHRAFPRIRMIATEPVTSRPMFAVDRHFYPHAPEGLAADAHLFDGLSPRGAKVLVGEYGVVQGSPTGTLAAALGEAAFLTGVIRDANVVLGASYAPLLVNVNDPDWPTSEIAFNGLTSAVSPSYYVQQMLSGALGSQVIGSQVIGGPGTLFDVATQGAGQVYLTVVNDGPTAASLPVSLVGVPAGTVTATGTVLTGSLTAQNTLADPGVVSPQSISLGTVGDSFLAQFPANSVTVLDLVTTPTVGAQGR